MSTAAAGGLNRPTLIIGLTLIAISVVTWRDAAAMQIRSSYGMGADAASYFVAAFLAVLGLAHLAAARRWQTEQGETDWRAVGWVTAGIVSLIACLWGGAGFVTGSTLLFALTARAFGRRALLVDLGLGLVMSIIIFLLFSKLLTLTLPMGPFERLF